MTGDKPRVSVIIPAYNAARYLPEAIESVLTQTYQDYEIILVDDGSTDDTKGVVSRYGTQVKYVYQENQGVGAARNAGIELASGDYLVFQDADDVLLPCKLESQVSFLDQHPDVDVVFSDVFCFWTDLTGKEWRQEFPSPERLKSALNEPAKAREVLLTENVFPPIAAMARSQCIRKIGGFDRDRALMSYEDWDLWYRLSHEHRFAYQDIYMAKYRLVGDSLSKNPRTVKRASESLEYKIEHSSAFPAFPGRTRSAFYFYWGALWLTYGESGVALDRFHKAVQINPHNVYAQSAYWLTKVMGRKAVVFYHLKRRLFGLRKLPGA